MYYLTHEEVKRILLIFLNYSSHEEFAAKKVRGHEGAIFRHANLIRTELHPICQSKHTTISTFFFFTIMKVIVLSVTCYSIHHLT